MPHFTTARRLGLLLALAGALAACGGQAPAAGEATRPPATSAPTPAATSAPTPAATSAPATTQATAAATAAAAAEDAIPSGRTPDGYNYLGSLDAPVVLQDFSDFL